MDYFSMLEKHGLFANVPTEEFIELLKFKLDALKQAKEQDSSWNYNIEELEQQINRIEGFVTLMRS